MIEGLDIQDAELAEWLAANVTGFSGFRNVEKFATGQSNPTYRIDADSGSYVLRTQPAGLLLKTAHMVDREYRVMSALRDTPVAVPRMFTFAMADNELIQRQFFVMEYLEGRIFWDPALREIKSKERGAIYDAMNLTLAALHDVQPDAVGLSDYGKPGNYFARQVDRWRKQYRASVIAPIPDMEWAMDWLAAHVPPDDGQVALVHGDFRLDNMIFHPTEPRVIGLLDWELSTLGHPLADLAYQCAQWRLPHDGPMRGLGGLDRSDIGLPQEEEYVAKYLERRGLGTIDNWPFYLTFSMFRFAAILQGVVRRAADGNASNPKLARTYGKAIPVLARMAVATAKS